MLRTLIISKKNIGLYILFFLLSSCIISNDSTYIDPNYLKPDEFKSYSELQETKIYSFFDDSISDGNKNEYDNYDYSYRIRRFHQPLYNYNYFGGIYYGYNDPFYFGNNSYFNYNYHGLNYYNNWHNNYNYGWYHQYDPYYYWYSPYYFGNYYSYHTYSYLNNHANKNTGRNHPNGKRISLNKKSKANFNNNLYRNNLYSNKKFDDKNFRSNENLNNRSNSRSNFKSNSRSNFKSNSRSNFKSNSRSNFKSNYNRKHNKINSRP